MAMHEATRIRPRVLLVSDDDPYSAGLKPQLRYANVLSLPESSVWVAIRAGLDVTRGVDAVLLDRGVSGRLQLRMYETLRPADRPATVPVVFVRSKLTAASAGFNHELDVYQPEDATLDQTGRLVGHVLSALTGAAGAQGHDPLMPAGVAPRMSAPVTGTAVGRPARVPVALGPGTAQRAGLWGVAMVLIGFTFWPLIGSGPVRDAIFGPLKSLSGDQGKLATGGARTDTPR